MTKQTETRVQIQQERDILRLEVVRLQELLNVYGTAAASAVDDAARLNYLRDVVFVPQKCLGGGCYKTLWRARSDRWEFQSTEPYGEPRVADSFRAAIDDAIFDRNKKFKTY